MKKNKKTIISFFCIIIILLVIFFSKKSNADTSKIVENKEQIAEVSNQTIITTLTAPGEVQSANVEKISLNTSYYFLTMCAEKEEYVKKGSNLLMYTNGTYIAAPYDCVIMEYSVPTAKSICSSNNYISIASVEDLYMDINISEDKIDKISSGQDVEIIVNYDESKVYTGLISKINAIGTHGLSGTNFAAIASLKNDGNLKLGMSATCTVIINKQENLPCLPINAIEIENNKKYVNLINENGEENRIEIETGVSDANYVEIKSGLTLGDKVKYETTTITVNAENNKNENPLSSLFNMGGESKGRRNERGGF